MTATSWTSRDAHYRERIYRALVDRAHEPPWKRTTLMLALAAHMPPDLGHRMLRAMEVDGLVYGSPGERDTTVWRLRKRGREE